MNDYQERSQQFKMKGSTQMAKYQETQTKISSKQPSPTVVGFTSIYIILAAILLLGALIAGNIAVWSYIF